MTLAIVYGRASSGMDAPLVTVEVHISRGTVKFNMVGLPEAVVKESRDRVRSALVNSQFDFPGKRLTVNLAPADLPKEGSRFDLPIALGILAATLQIPQSELANYEFIGELALSGDLRPVRGILPAVLASQQSGRTLVLPAANAREAALARHVKVLSAAHLLEVCAHLKGLAPLPVCSETEKLTQPAPSADLADVKGQTHAKRALEIAAAGRHSLLMLGPPGTGKTLLANRLAGILPPINKEQALDVAAITSLSKTGFDPRQWQVLPFRAPHHTSSSVALVGGGRPPAPGEVSLAHHGVLFLDELPEFSRHVLECLREPLESGQITISRAAHQASFPASFQLITAMNPCPCGYAGSMDEDCECSAEQIKRYMAKISGPLLDRIDMHIEVARIPPEVLALNPDHATEKSAQVQARVIRAREYQYQRQGTCNANLNISDLALYCPLQPAAEALIQKVMSRLALSARGYHRIIKLARTIADLEENAMILDSHIAQALNYRCLDRSRR